jgi:uncharacterized protein (DUF1697 family)
VQKSGSKVYLLVESNSLSQEGATMKVTTLTKTYGRTVNIGTFNSIRFENTIEVVLEPGESTQEADKVLYELVKEATEEGILTKLNEIQAGRDEVFSHAIAQHDKKRG